MLSSVHYPQLLRLVAIARCTAHLATLAGRGRHGKTENQDSARVRGPLHDSERLRLVERPPHPDLLHSPSKTGVNALMARGEKELRGFGSLMASKQISISPRARGARAAPRTRAPAC